MPKTLLVSVVAALALAAAAPAHAAQPYPIDFHNFIKGASITLSTTGTAGQTTYADPHANYAGDGADGSGVYDYGTWTSPVYRPSFPFTQLVSSWNAATPAGTWIQVEVLPQFDDGHWSSKWYILGRWTYGDSDFHRTSVGGQGNSDGYVAIDTFIVKDHPAIAYQLRVTLLRRVKSKATPTLSRLSAVVSDLRNQKNTFPSASTITNAIDLGVPQYSQEIHHGEYPQFDNGGEAWCSPTSTAMVVAYFGKSPTSTETSWVDPAFADPWVDYTARYVYDYHYNGAGNWPFNTAYAAARGLTADVAQLHSLADAEPFIRAGVPLVASIAFTSNKLDGADIKSTNGHLAVIEGFTAGGSQVIVNDPASPTDGDVKHYYDREQFERAWIPASGGIVYVIRPAGKLAESALTANNS